MSNANILAPGAPCAKANVGYVPKEVPRRSQGILVRRMSPSVVADHADLARLAHDPRARIT